MGSDLLHSAEDWPAFAGVDWPRTIMSVPVTDRLFAKQGRSIGRWKLTNVSGRELVVYLKRHFELPWYHAVLAKLFPSRAWSPGVEEWEHLQWAARAGIPVPRAVAAGEFRGPGVRLQSFLAVEELTDELGLHEAVPLASRRLNGEDFARWKRGLVAEVARLSRELHRRRMFHKDLYFCHFYIPEADTQRVPESWLGRVHMIDLHRLGSHRLGWLWFVVKDLAQFLYSSDEPGVTARDRLRFWKFYRQGEWGPAKRPPAWIRRFVRIKAERYARHNAKRPAIAPKGP
jgi:heptose I phosphotransferase